MILSFKDKETEKIFNQEFSKKLPHDIQIRAFLLLIAIDRVKSLDELSHPPGNKLEALKGARAGEWSVRINKQWRITFTPVEGGKNYENVQIEDYH